MKIKKIISAVLIAVTCIVNIAPASYAAVPGLNAKATKDNIMKIANKYDKDGAYILKQTDYDDWTFWFFGAGSIASEMDSAVHEQTHSFTGGFGSENIYMMIQKKMLLHHNQVMAAPPLRIYLHIL